jgi:two-component system NtrC family response regulator
LPETVMPHLLSYRWPGNVRELENVMERLVLLSRTEEVTAADLPERLRPLSPDSQKAASPGGGTALKVVERDLILQVLRQCNWNQSKAARQLDISRKTLLYRMTKYGISRDAVEASGRGHVVTAGASHY